MKVKIIKIKDEDLIYVSQDSLNKKRLACNDMRCANIGCTDCPLEKIDIYEGILTSDLNIIEVEI